MNKKGKKKVPSPSSPFYLSSSNRSFLLQSPSQKVDTSCLLRYGKQKEIDVCAPSVHDTAHQTMQNAKKMTVGTSSSPTHCNNNSLGNIM